MHSARSLPRLLSALLFGALLLHAVPAGAVPARRLTEPLPPAAAGEGSCERPVRRFLGGPGRRPGATVVPVTLRLEVQDENGQFRSASTDRTRAVVPGDEATFRVTVSNLSLYDVGNVLLKHAYRSGSSGPDSEGIGSVQGARFDEWTNTFLLERIPSDEAVTFTFRLFLSDVVGTELLQSKVTLEDFEVLESERRFPQFFPETPAGRSTQTVARVGIGGTDVACFAARIYRLPSAERFDIPPALEPVAGSALLSVEKSANLKEAQPGAIVTYTIIVQNRSAQALRDIVIDDRFSPSHLRVIDAGGGDPLASGLQWFLPEVAPNERFVARYRAEVLTGVENGERIPNTVTVIGEQLRDIPTGNRQDTAEVAVLTRMPQTGVELRMLFLVGQLIVALALVALLLRISLAASLFSARRWMR